MPHTKIIFGQDNTMSVNVWENKIVWQCKEREIIKKVSKLKKKKKMFQVEIVRMGRMPEGKESMQRMGLEKMRDAKN